MKATFAVLQLACSAQPSCVRIPSAPGKILKTVPPALNHEHSRQNLKAAWCCELLLRIFNGGGDTSHCHYQLDEAAAATASAMASLPNFYLCPTYMREWYVWSSVLDYCQLLPSIRAGPCTAHHLAEPHFASSSHQHGDLVVWSGLLFAGSTCS